MFDLVWLLTNPKSYFVALVGGGIFLLGMFYLKYAEQAEGEYTLSAFAVDMAETLDLPSIPGVYESENAVAMAPDGGMAIALPPEVDGWTRRDFHMADADALIAGSDRISEVAAVRARALQSELEDAVSGNSTAVLATYARGAELVVFEIEKSPVPLGRGAGLSDAERQRAIDLAVGTDFMPLAVHGADFLARPGALSDSLQELPYETLRASVANQVVIEVATNTDRASLVTLLSGMNVAALQAFADKADPFISAAKGVQTAPARVEVTRAAPPIPSRIQPAPDRIQSAPDRTQPAPAAEAADPGDTPVVCVRRAGVRVCE